jgi:tRNA-splicing ligase RtcB
MRDHPAANGLIAMMPDCHAGAGCTVGTTMEIGDKIVPNWIGVDIGCFTGDTKIPLLSGIQKSIKSLVGTGEFYVYSLDTNLKLVPGKAIAVKTRSLASLMEVAISGGEIVRCTPDHLFMMIDGSYKRADELKAFDSLMPLYKSYQTRDGYEYITTRKDSGLTHQIVASYFNSNISDSHCIHHKDINWYNNDPSNLVVMLKTEHSALHAKLNNNFCNPDFQSKKMKTISERGYYCHPMFAESKRETAINNITTYMDENPDHFVEVCRKNGERGGEHFKEWNQKEVKCEICGKICKQGGLSSHMRTHDQNHKVLYTSHLNYKEDVYCLQVEEFHNFALSAGVFVHNCGVDGVKIPDIDIDFPELDRLIRESVPLGMKRNDKIKGFEIFGPKFLDEADEVARRIGYQSDIRSQLGSLGGGNHFIEIGQGDGCKWIFVHSGSRHFGLSVAKHYQAKAKDYCAANNIHVPKDTEYLPMDEGGDDYLRDMKVAQKFAGSNRSLIIHRILKALGSPEVIELIISIHNFIGNDNICRKGAISAYHGEKVLIPLNMRDGTIIGTGKGNIEYNMSAPHGAGRGLGSRGAVKRMLKDGILTMEQFEKEMEGIYSTSIKPSTIDESPFAYKPFSQIEEYLKETVTIDEIVKPIYNLKDG